MIKVAHESFLGAVVFWLNMHSRFSRYDYSMCIAVQYTTLTLTDCIALKLDIVFSDHYSTPQYRLYSIQYTVQNIQIQYTI